MKPVALVERAIRSSSKSRDIVLDPFGGSGTTLIAAERTERRARVIELDPKYVDVTIQRWQKIHWQDRVAGQEWLIVLSKHKKGIVKHSPVLKKVTRAMGFGGQ
jgi:predicted O-methyltransferase YrrM